MNKMESFMATLGGRKHTLGAPSRMRLLGTARAFYTRTSFSIKRVPLL